jgi:hypothetical protein
MKIRDLIARLLEIRNLEAEATIRVASFNKDDSIDTVRHAPVAYMHGNQIAIREDQMSRPSRP